MELADINKEKAVTLSEDGKQFETVLRNVFVVGKDKAEIAVTALNALNDQHKEHPEGDTIGSRVMGWLTIKY